MSDYLRIKYGLIQYTRIMNSFNKCNVSENKEFQTLFNGFYRVRRNASWRKVYYDLFEKAKYQSYNFEEIVTYIYEKTGRIEASFSSKLYATINPNKPIWDQYVLKSLNIKIKQYYKSKADKLSDIIMYYHNIEKWYENIDNKLIDEFNKEFPDYSWISDVKKCDFILWGKRDNKSNAL